MMGLYNFHARFVPFILDGRKTHTIRGTRAFQDVVGSTMHLYTGLRTKRAKLLMRAPCVRVEDIEFETEKRGLDRIVRVYINGQELTLDEREGLARRDGFPNFAEMMKFWKGRLPFTGHIIHWRFHQEKQ